MTRWEPALSMREHQRLADALFGAAAGRRAPAPLTRPPDLTAADAPRIGDPLLERRLAEGEQLIGAKVSVGPDDEVPQPRFAWLTDGMLHSSGDVDVSDLLRARVEPKLAFRLGRPLRGAIPTAGDVLAATDRVMPCLDILDSRLDPSGATAMLLMGEGASPPADGHLLRVRVQVRVDGPDPDSVETPARLRSRVAALEAVSWLGGRLVEKSLGPGPGALLVSHAIGIPIELTTGVRLIAHFSGLGTVQLGA